MIYTSIYFYFISIAIASVTIYISYKMYRDYKLQYLSYWFYYIIFLNLGFFFFYTIRFLILDLLKLDPWQIKKIYIILLVFLLRPVIIVGLFLFIKFSCCVSVSLFSKGCDLSSFWKSLCWRELCTYDSCFRVFC